MGEGGLVAPNGLVTGNDGVLGHLDFRFCIKDARLLKEQVVAYGECEQAGGNTAINTTSRRTSLYQ